MSTEPWNLAKPASGGRWLGTALLAGLLCLSAAAHPALGAEKTPAGEGGTPSKSPLRIQSQQLVADMNANTAEFSDQVRMVNDTYTITADILMLYFKPQAEGQSRMQSKVTGKDISRMVARGEVVIRTETMTASSDVAEYEPDAGLVTLSSEVAASPNPATAKASGGVPAAAGRSTTSPELIPGRVRVVILPSPNRR
jgi:lipopolysaccharide export system protein LptA